MTTKIAFEHVPESAYQSSRRQFPKRILGELAASAVLPSISFSGTELLANQLAKAGEALTASDAGNECFWQMVKEQFPLRPGLTLMNAANLCPSPYPVIEAVFGLFPKLFSGNHITADEVETFKVKKIRINAVEPLMLAPDGELLGCTPLQVECLHQAVEFFT